ASARWPSRARLRSPASLTPSASQRTQPASAPLHHRPEADVHVWLFDGRHAAELLHVLGAFLHDGVDNVVDRDDPNDTTVVDDRHREQVVLRDQARDIFPVHEGSGGKAHGGTLDVNSTADETRFTGSPSGQDDY